MGSADSLLQFRTLVRTRGGFRIDRQQVAAVADDEVLLGMHLVGICGTDTDMIRGRRSDTAQILGHEGVASVLALGRAVSGVSLGDRVVFNPVDPTDQDSILGHSYDGLLRERLVVRTADMPHLLVKVLGDLPSRLAVLSEPLATAVYGVELVEAAVGSIRSAIVVGGGSFGLLVSSILTSRGCQVLLVEPSRHRREWAIDNGVATRDNVIARLSPASRRFGGAGADVGFVCTPRGAAMEAFYAACASVRDGGCVDLVTGFEPGMGVPGLSVDINDVRRNNVSGVGKPKFSQYSTAGAKKIWLTGHRGSSLEHVTAAMRWLHTLPVLSDLISHVLTLDAARDYFQSLSLGAPQYVAGSSRKLVVDVHS